MAVHKPLSKEASPRTLWGPRGWSIDPYERSKGAKTSAECCNVRMVIRISRKHKFRIGSRHIGLLLPHAHHHNFIRPVAESLISEMHFTSQPFSEGAKQTPAVLARIHFGSPPKRVVEIGGQRSINVKWAVGISAVCNCTVDGCTRNVPEGRAVWGATASACGEMASRLMHRVARSVLGAKLATDILAWLGLKLSRIAGRDCFSPRSGVFRYGLIAVFVRPSKHEGLFAFLFLNLILPGRVCVARTRIVDDVACLRAL